MIHQFKSGDLFNERYQLEKLVGVGGFADVWRFAVKVASDFAMYELTGDAKYLGRFEATPDSLPLMRQYGSWALDQYRVAHDLLYLQYLGYKDADADVKGIADQPNVNLAPREIDGKVIFR